MRAIQLCAVLLAGCLASVGAAAQTPADTCDALAGSGQPLAAERLLEAVEACSQAVRDNPGDVRLLAHYALTLELSGDIVMATRLYEWAAGDGYQPAAAALARLAGAPPPDDSDAVADSGADQTADTAATDTPTADTPADRLDRIAALLEQARGLLPRDSFDPAAVVAAVGGDPDDLTAWVADNTGLVAYRGRLRGPVGVLLDRRGNSLDRALLLANLLEAAGRQPVLANAELSAEEAGRLFDARRAPPPPSGDGLSRAEALAALGIDAAGDPLGVAAAMERDAREAADTRTALMQRTRQQADALMALVGPAAAPSADARASAVAALRDHWWVRLRTADGWQDLDPSGAQLAGGAVRELAPADLPADLSQRVTVSVVAAFRDADGALRQETLLSRALVPAELAGVPVTLWHEPLGLSDPLSLRAAMPRSLSRRCWLNGRGSRC
ncbi:MAG: hypothetical protein R3F55_21295 [Alphaproteobacteria bacterium]